MHYIIIINEKLTIYCLIINQFDVFLVKIEENEVEIERIYKIKMRSSWIDS